MIARLPQRPRVSQVARRQHPRRLPDPNASIAVDDDRREVRIRARLKPAEVASALAALDFTPVALMPSSGGCGGG